MFQSDAAVKFTLQYLGVLEKCLKISWNAETRPVCVIDWINDSDVGSMRDELEALMGSDLHANARQATIDFGRNHIQTVGFGLAPNFDQFIKLGFIYGERLVLWDLISSRVLAAGKSAQQSKSLLAQIACELLLLRPVVERGGLVILPHPITWSPLAAEIDTELRAAGGVPTASLGLSMAFAAIEDGMPLHPYTLLADGPMPLTIDRVGGQVDELFSSENYVFQQAIGTLLRDQRVAYLQDVRVEDFFDIVARHSALRRALRKHFSPTLNGLSVQQASHEGDALTSDLVDLIEKRNAAVIDYAAEGVDATAKFLLASVASITIGQPLLSTLAVAGTLAVPLSTAVRKWVKKPERNVIVQAFQELRAVSESPRTSSSGKAPSKNAIESNVHASVDELYARFMSYHWTEQRHHFLETLSPEVAKALLKMLQPEDLEVIVNARRFQQDYIGDYLAYLSELDEDIYWEHLGKTFESSEGLLIYDDDAHICAMETWDMPIRAWRQLLDSLFEVYADELRARDYGYPLQRFPTIVRFQTERALHVNEKRADLVGLFESLNSDEQAALTHFLAEAFDSDLPRWFMDRETLRSP